MEELGGNLPDPAIWKSSSSPQGLSQRAARFCRRYARVIVFAALLLSSVRYYLSVSQVWNTTPRERHLIQHGASRHSAWPGWSGIKTIIALCVWYPHVVRKAQS